MAKFNLPRVVELAENILERKHSRMEVPLARKKASSVWAGGGGSGPIVAAMLLPTASEDWY